MLLALLVASSCQGETYEPTGGETHFLMRCEPGSTACSAGLVCECGVCTATCDQTSQCQRFPGAQCTAPGTGAACANPQAPGYCDVECTLDSECAGLSPAHRCERGACRAPLPGGLGRTPNACADGAVSANQVLLIGDSFLATSHQITAYLEELARDAGALAAGERYRDDSRLTGNALALGGNGIADQYESAAAETEVKVVIMNGGGADVFLGSCESADASCPVISDAAAAAENLLSTMAEDGVLHVVYAFYPDPVDAGVRAKMDALRPLIQSACATSPVPCHWLDLRPTFAGKYATYVLDDGMNPTAAGSQASAGAIWTTMETNCVAQ